MLGVPSCLRSWVNRSLLYSLSTFSFQDSARRRIILPTVFGKYLEVRFNKQLLMQYTESAKFMAT